MSYEKLEYRVHDDGDISYHNEDGYLHRPNGPAIIFDDGKKAWYLNDKEMTESEWKIATSPPTEMTVEEISKALGHRVKVVE